MASFYRTDNDWEQGEKIPLIDMFENGTALSMSTCITSDILKKEGENLFTCTTFFLCGLFLSNYLKLLIKMRKNYHIIALSFGNLPDEAPEKEFTGENLLNDDYIFNDESDFENMDDIDLDNY